MHAEVGIVATICKLDGSLPVDQCGFGVIVGFDKFSCNHEKLTVLGRSVGGVLRLLRLSWDRLDLAHYGTEALPGFHESSELPESDPCIHEDENPGRLGKGPLLKLSPLPMLKVVRQCDQVGSGHAQMPRGIVGPAIPPDSAEQHIVKHLLVQSSSTSMTDCCVQEVHAFRVTRLRWCRIAVVSKEPAVPFHPPLLISCLQFITEVFAHQRMRIQGTRPVRVLFIQQTHSPERIDAPVPDIPTHAIKFGGKEIEIPACEQSTHRLWWRRSIEEPDKMKKRQL